MSGRASYKLTQKAVLAGIGVLIAVSAPSSMAVGLAATAGLTLIGFARCATMNVHTHPERVDGMITIADPGMSTGERLESGPVPARAARGAAQPGARRAEMTT